MPSSMFYDRRDYSYYGEIGEEVRYLRVIWYTRICVFEDSGKGMVADEMGRVNMTIWFGQETIGSFKIPGGNVWGSLFD